MLPGRCAQVAWHHGATIPVANRALDRHCPLLATECLTSPASEIEVPDVFVDDTVAILMYGDVARVTVDDFIVLFVVIIATDQALVVEWITSTPVVVLEMLWDWLDKRVSKHTWLVPSLI